jgi:hypothetical protein
VAATHDPTTNVMLLQQIIGRDKINRCLSKRKIHDTQEMKLGTVYGPWITLSMNEAE